MASWAGFFSPVSGQIYFPALNALAEDLHVTDTLINLTLTSYMVCAASSVKHSTGLNRCVDISRPCAYVCWRPCGCCGSTACICWYARQAWTSRLGLTRLTVCFTIYILANIGLALQNSYAALFVLRCFQSTGSSATIAMCSAVVADVATPAERGKYMGFTLAGSLLGPAIGPVIGGVLAQFLGWRSIFWFLMIMGSAFMCVFAIFFPETGNVTPHAPKRYCYS
jgi:multidrug resistance protein